MLKTISIIVSGKVQGVFYRQSTKEKADELGIQGIVRNMPDETVYIEATGNKEQLEKLKAWCHHGPRKAVVTGVQIKEIALKDFSKFTIERH